MTSKVQNLHFLSALLSIACLAAPTSALGNEFDQRLASVNCSVSDADVLSCRYRTAPSVSLKEVSIRVGGDPEQIPEDGLKAFPSEGQSVAALILLDTSDPSRKSTVENKAVKLANQFIVSRKEFEKLGVATFDSDLVMLAPVGSSSNDLAAALNRVKATGQSTEFYKSILAAIEILKNTEADRKGLVVISDGKDEDKAYSLADVVKSAQAANVAILGIGIAEKLADTPYLQTLKRLSDETYGEYINATEGKLPATLLSKPLSFIERGGEVQINIAGYHGHQNVVLQLGTTDGKLLDLSTEVDFDQERTFFYRAYGTLLKYKLILSVGLLILLTAIFIGIRVRRSRKDKEVERIEYAYLAETDGLGTIHKICQTAVRIGRNKDNDIVLLNDSISSHHAEIHMRREGAFYIVDLSSTNGVFVNTQRVNQTEIKDGDLVELGEVRLKFVVTI